MEPGQELRAPALKRVLCRQLSLRCKIRGTRHPKCYLSPPPSSGIEGAFRKKTAHIYAELAVLFMDCSRFHLLSPRSYMQWDGKHYFHGLYEKTKAICPRSHSSRPKETQVSWLLAKRVWLVYQAAALPVPH